MLATEVFEFGGMVIDPTYQGKGLVKMMSDTARLFLFSRRPKLIITNPVEPLYELYKQLGLKTVGRAPVEHPHAYNVKVWLMYGKFDELSKPYFM
jgi:ribosomal protein S18 acetylase RimI-like enzyme